MDVSVCPMCSVCLKKFTDERSPRSLDCGHSVCSSCIEHLLYNYDRSCPECRMAFKAERIEDLPINHQILRISRMFNFALLEPGNIPPVRLISDHPVREPLKSSGICSEHGHQLFFLCMRCLSSACRGCLAVNHPDPPRGRCTIVGLQEGMDKINSVHQKVIESHLKEAEQHSVKLKNVVRSFIDVFQYFKDTASDGDNKSREKRLLVINEEREKSQSQITALETQISSLRRASVIIKEAQNLEGIITAHEDCLKVESAFEKFMTKEREKERERRMTSLIKLLLPNETDLVDMFKADTPVYAIQETEDKCRWAEVVCKDYTILLYSLRDGNPPKEGVRIPFELLRALVPQMSPTVFMDIEGDGRYVGRIHIQMFGDTARGRQAVLLCSGERGPSYRNTNFYDGYHHEDDDACLKGGDYENDNGTGGRAIVDDITDDDIYKMQIKAGLMVGWPADEHYRLGSFRLYTFEYDEIIAEHAFGIVTENMELVEDWLGCEDDGYANEKVLDCGLVLNF